MTKKQWTKLIIAILTAVAAALGGASLTTSCTFRMYGTKVMLTDSTKQLTSDTLTVKNN